MTNSTILLSKKILGYSDPLSVAPGEPITFYVSCSPDLTSYEAELVRLRAGAPGWENSAPDCSLINSSVNGRYAATTQAIHPGSYALIPTATAPANDNGALTILVLVQPTHSPGVPQVVFSHGDPWHELGFALTLDESMRPSLLLGPDARTALTALQPLAMHRWTALTVTFNTSGNLTLSAGGFGATTATVAATVAATYWLPELRSADLVLAAVRSPESGITRHHYTGRLEAPTIWYAKLELSDALDSYPRGSNASSERGSEAELLAAWDFSSGIDTWSITDIGSHGLHGTLHNLPMRAVRGSRWTGEYDAWTEAPHQYAALHFLADALEDCHWTAAFTLVTPTDLRSGFYAVRLTSGLNTDYLPFFIRPSEHTTAKVLLIAPTATYNAYANSRFWWESPIQEMVQDRLVEIGAEDQYLLTHPEIGLSSYDCHLDGTDVCYVSRRRPNLSLRPCHVRREGYPSDLYLVAWLERMGIEYDVATDEDLHIQGQALLDQYSLTLTGTHPEYMSERMFDAFGNWITDGGRLMYMGGNGFSMNVNFDPDRPWIMENRRVDLWERDATFQRSEALNSTDAKWGGYFNASGRESTQVTGVESATMGFDHSYPYVLKPDAHRPEAEFVFAGVTATTIGDFGALGGGVVGQEWDNAAGHEFGPEHLILASSQDHTLVPALFGAVRPDYHADLVLVMRGPGAAFSVSSMAWCGSLGEADYDNDISRITLNVLQRFLDPTPFPTPANKGAAS
jgi:N,N-dimethylformamidase